MPPARPRLLLALALTLLFSAGCFTPATSPTDPPLTLSAPFRSALSKDAKRVFVFPPGTYIPTRQFGEGPYGPGVYYTAPAQIIELGGMATPGGVFIPSASNKDQRMCVYRWNDILLRSALAAPIPFESAKPPALDTRSP